MNAILLYRKCNHGRNWLKRKSLFEKEGKAGHMAKIAGDTSVFREEIILLIRCAPQRVNCKVGHKPDLCLNKIPSTNVLIKVVFI